MTSDTEKTWLLITTPYIFELIFSQKKGQPRKGCAVNINVDKKFSYTWTKCIIRFYMKTYVLLS